MTTPDNDDTATAKERFQNATDALRHAPTAADNDGVHSVGHLADQASVEVDHAKQHAVSAIDAALQSATDATKKARSTYRRNPRKTLAAIGAVAVGIVALVTLLRRL